MPLVSLANVQYNCTMECADSICARSSHFIHLLPQQTETKIKSSWRLCVVYGYVEAKNVLLVFFLLRNMKCHGGRQFNHILCQFNIDTSLRDMELCALCFFCVILFLKWQDNKR